MTAVFIPSESWGSRHCPDWGSQPCPDDVASGYWMVGSGGRFKSTAGFLRHLVHGEIPVGVDLIHDFVVER